MSNATECVCMLSNALRSVGGMEVTVCTVSSEHKVVMNFRDSAVTAVLARKGRQYFHVGSLDVPQNRLWRGKVQFPCAYYETDTSCTARSLYFVLYFGAVYSLLGSSSCRSWLYMFCYVFRPTKPSSENCSLSTCNLCKFYVVHAVWLFSVWCPNCPFDGFRCGHTCFGVFYAFLSTEMRTPTPENLKKAVGFHVHVQL